MHKLELERAAGETRQGLEAQNADADRARRDAETQAKIERERRLTRAKTNAMNAVNRMNAVSSVTGFQPTTPADIMNEEPAYPEGL